MPAPFSCVSCGWRLKLTTVILAIAYILALLTVIFGFLNASYFVLTKQYSTKESSAVILSFDGQKEFALSSILNSAPQSKTSWRRSNHEGNFSNVTILMWTRYYGNKDLIDHIRQEAPVPDWCQVTFDRQTLNESDAIIFHVIASDFLAKDLPLRNPNQLWVYFALESPAYAQKPPNDINGIFNRTMTYRLDSDYPCPYGYFSKREQHLNKNPYKNPYKSDHKFPRTKTKLIAWMVSHCDTLSAREQLVQKMITQGNLRIDIFGSCGKFECDKSQEIACYEKLGLTYKFYLSFENSVCRDYVTEKFTNALHANMVPIVYGGGDYKSILPSYPKPTSIDVRDFATPKKLSDYLLYLDKNETAYSEYFEWRRFYNLHIRQGFGGFRKLCYDLQNPEIVHRVYEDMHRWWVQDSRCWNYQHLHWS